MAWKRGIALALARPNKLPLHWRAKFFQCRLRPSSFNFGILEPCIQGDSRTAGNRFARDDKELGPQLGGNNYPESGLVKPPRRDTQAPSPAGMFGGKAPLRLVAQKIRLHAP
jgi:hypothetical protein